MQLSANALTVLKKRYLAPSQTDPDSLETPDEMWRRVARTLAVVDRHYGRDANAVDATEDRFYNLISSLDFLPNSPTLANAVPKGAIL